MKRKILLLCVICGLCLSLFVPAWAEESFTVMPKVDFDKGKLTVTIQSPARYSQNILVTLYPRGTVITDPTQYIRMGDCYADSEGTAQIVFSLSTGVASGYYTVSASGGGYLADICHNTANVYFETTEDLNKLTLPAVSTATGDALDEQLVKLETYFGVDLGAFHKTDKEAFLRYFQAVRQNDYNNMLDTMDKVQSTADRANLILTTLAAKTQSDIESLYESNSGALQFDLHDEDYTQNKNEIYRLYLGLVQGTKAEIASMSDLRLLFRQAMGMAVINVKNAETVTDTIEKYAAVFDIPKEAYKSLCQKHGAVTVNKDFIGRNFTVPASVLAAYQSAVESLNEAKDSSLKPSGGGGKGSGASGSFKTITSGKEEPIKPQTEVFSDVSPDHWAYESILMLHQIGVINGFADGSFHPDEAVTREQFVKMLAQSLSLPKVTEKVEFADVPSEHWAADSIAAAVSAKLVSGISQTEFGLGAVLTRQDAAVLTERAAAYLGRTYTTEASVEYADRAQIADYAQESVAKLSASGIIGGMDDGCFAPQLALTRAQTAKLLFGLLTIR